MPFKSEKQRRWMWANDPEMARKWADKEKDKKSKDKKKDKQSKEAYLRGYLHG